MCGLPPGPTTTDDAELGMPGEWSTAPNSSQWAARVVSRWDTTNVRGSVIRCFLRWLATCAELIVKIVCQLTEFRAKLKT